MKERQKQQKEREKTLKERQKSRELRQKEREKAQEKKMKQKEKQQEKLTQQKEKKEKQVATKPKRSISAYAFYVKENIQTLAAENPDMKLSERMIKLAQNWNKLTDEEKQPYLDKSQQDKQRKNIETQAYQKSLPPKRPLTPFLLFSNEHRKKLQEENPGTKITELMKMLAERWKALSDEQKKNYEQQAEKNKQAYLIEKEKFEKSS